MKKRGIKIIKYSIFFMIVTSLPLILYILFGPKDGNPVGLGLLSFTGVLSGQLGLFVGIIYMMIGSIVDDEITRIVNTPTTNP